MAQGPLIRAATAGAVLTLGVAAELAAPESAALTLADFAVGAGLGWGGAYLLVRAPRTAVLALAAALAWFAGTLAGADGILGGAGAMLVLAYRGPLLHLLLAPPSVRAGRRRAQALAAASWAAGVLPLVIARPATTAVALLVAAGTGGAARRAATDMRRALAATSLASGSLAVLWAVTAFGFGGGADWLVLNDLAVAVAAAIGLSVAAGVWTHGVARAVVVELGPSRRPGRPLTTRLSRALADPDLEIRYKVDGVGWVDEQGLAAPSPDDDARTVTRASAPEGDEVALVHGEAATTDRRLAKAAAAAAALALEAARLEAEVRARADEVRASRLRFLGVADAERRTLEQRLSDSVLARLRRVERLLMELPDAKDAERSELRAAMAELVALGRGLYPPALARADLVRALGELAERSPVPASVHIEGQIDGVSETHRAAFWFICSEALTNVTRHAHASRVDVVLRGDTQHLELEIHDDGRGGATLDRGLRGLADRVDALGGKLCVESPPGGPTTIRARLTR